MNADELKKADEIVRALRDYASDCDDGEACRQCTFAWMCDECSGNAPKIIADLIDSLTAQLAESRRRAERAVEDLAFACGSQPNTSDDCSICDICKYKQNDGSCPKQCFMNSLGASNRWQWRGDAEKGAADGN